MPSIEIGTADFRKFSRALGKAAPELRRAMNKNLKVAGQLVATKAKANVEPYSTSIPPTIRVSLAKGSVTVLAGNNAIAGLLERGNAGGSTGGNFRHPVFGDTDQWVSQPMHPYLARALASEGDKAVELIHEAIEDAIEEAVRF